MVRLNENLQIQSGVSGPLNQTLIDDLKKVANNINSVDPGFVITITSGNRGKKDVTASGNLSRHATGNAIDIALINGVAFKTNQKEFTRLGNIVVSELIKLGYKQVNGESGVEKAILWQTKDHYNHIHVSNKTGVVKNIDMSQPNQSDNPVLDNTQITKDNELDLKGDPYVTSLFNGSFKPGQVKEGYIFSDVEKYRDDKILISHSNIHEIIFPFEKGKVISIQDDNNSLNIKINSKVKDFSFRLNLYNIAKSNVVVGSILHQSDVIGESKNAVIEITDSFNKVVKIDKIEKLLAGDEEPKNENPEYKDKKKNFKYIGSPTSKETVTDEWIYKQIYNYINNKWKKR